MFKNRNYYIFGALYSGVPMQDRFVKSNFAGIGYRLSEAPELYAIMDSIKVGDVIALKACGPSSVTMTIHAIGFCKNNIIRYREDSLGSLGWGIEVDWIVVGSKKLPRRFIKDKIWHWRNGSLYPEYSPNVRKYLKKQLIAALLPHSSKLASVALAA